ncbi:MAG: hypothetical protein K0R51_958 [Cytophagaceae bacterium]|jgi:uncharacterized protein|nr:hypothetical protein [Cytophagaceae bacterium]
MSFTLSSRIFVVDALRGFALTGILLLHAIEHFDLLLYPHSETGWLAILNPIVSTILFFIFAGKAYSIFSILFGLSFYLQMKKQADRGIDFQGRFIWRLVLLFAFGYLLSLVYIGEILTAFALLGLLLILLHRLSNRWLVILAVLFLLQVPTLFLLRLSFSQPDFYYELNWSAWENVYSTFSKGSFLDVMQFNAYQGHLAKWQFFLNTGRYLQLIGLFIIGLLIGRINYFENLKQHLPATRIIALVSGLLFASVYTASFFIENHFSPAQTLLIRTLLDSYGNLFFTSLLFALFILLAMEWNIENKKTVLASYGKMSLTNYFLQPLIGVPFFYGFGLSMYQLCGVTLSLLFGIVLLILQMLFSSYWMKRYHYGPLEWLWRALTFWDFSIPMKK